MIYVMLVYYTLVGYPHRLYIMRIRGSTPGPCYIGSREKESRALKKKPALDEGRQEITQYPNGLNLTWDV